MHEVAPAKPRPYSPRRSGRGVAQALNRLLGDPAALENYRQRISAHLAKYSKAALLDACEAAILDAVTNDAGALASPHR